MELDSLIYIEYVCMGLSCLYGFGGALGVIWGIFGK